MAEWRYNAKNSEVRNMMQEIGRIYVRITFTSLRDGHRYTMWGPAGTPERVKV